MPSPPWQMNGVRISYHAPETRRRDHASWVKKLQLLHLTFISHMWSVIRSPDQHREWWAENDKEGQGEERPRAIWTDIYRHCLIGTLLLLQKTRFFKKRDWKWAQDDWEKPWKILHTGHIQSICLSHSQQMEISCRGCCIACVNMTSPV